MDMRVGTVKAQRPSPLSVHICGHLHILGPDVPAPHSELVGLSLVLWVQAFLFSPLYHQNALQMSFFMLESEHVCSSTLQLFQLKSLEQAPHTALLSLCFLACEMGITMFRSQTCSK